MVPVSLVFGVFAFFFGLIVGSFLNVCIYRLPRVESLVYPPSHCPRCNQPIRWEDNIPVISWLLLRAKCRDCGQPISPIYPVVELLTGAIFFLYFARLVGFTAEPAPGVLALYAVHVAFISALIVATAIDFKYFIIPDEISIPGFILAIILSLALPAMHPDHVLPSWPHLGSMMSSITGALAGAGVIWGIGVAGKVILRKEAMGFGDVKLMALIGAVLGWKLVIFVLFFSAFLGTAYGVARMAATGDTKIPYGPFLSAAAVICLIFRPEINRFLADIIANYSLLLR